MIVPGMVFSAKIKIPTEKFNGREALGSLREALFEILLPVILVAGYFSGILTLLEISAVSVIYVVIVEVFIKKDIAVRQIPAVLGKAVPIVGGILIILAMAKALSYAIVYSRVPENFIFWMQSAVESKYVFLLLLNLALLLVGCVMDMFSAILVLLPLIVPLGHAYGIDPVHIGIIFLVNLEAGFLTPPVGINLFLASYRFEQPFMRVCRYVLPSIGIRIAIVLLVTFIPWLSTWLPSLF
jgi:tripartite ATP-independent transporter DctM subunit